MPNLFEVAARISLDTSEYERGLDKAGKQTSSFGEKLKSGLVNASKVAVAAVGTLSVAAVGATAKMAKAAMDAYGDYQQLQGGIETLFGDAAKTVAENAKEAFETAGMSINEYYETSIQSAAALIKSLGDDRQKAADLMNMSVIDMADNVNKMGTTMEAVQNAYRGFSRGNFTMLDNLALGFAGTKQGMEELLEAAKNLSGVEYDINSYADIVEAIHVVQTEYGITGTTAKEASETLTGSLSAVRSAWKNLIAGVANPTANLNKLISNLVGTVKTALKNIMPILKQSLSGIAELIKEIAPVIADELPGLIEELVPMFLSSVESIVNAIVKALPGITQAIIKVAPRIIRSFIDTVTNLLPQIVELGLELVITLAEGIADNIEEIVPAVISTVLKIVEILTNPENIRRIISAAVEIIVALANGLTESIPLIVKELPKIIDGIIEGLLGGNGENLQRIINAGVQLFGALVDNIPAIVDTLIDSIPRIIDGLVGGITGTNSKQKIKDAGTNLMGNLFSDTTGIESEMKVDILGIIGRVGDVLQSVDPARLMRKIGISLASKLTGGFSDKVIAWLTGTSLPEEAHISSSGASHKGGGGSFGEGAGQKYAIEDYGPQPLTRNGRIVSGTAERVTARPATEKSTQITVNAEIDGYVLAQAVGTIDNDEKRMW